MSGGVPEVAIFVYLWCRNGLQIVTLTFVQAFKQTISCTNINPDCKRLIGRSIEALWAGLGNALVYM